MSPESLLEAKKNVAHTAAPVRSLPEPRSFELPRSPENTPAATTAGHDFGHMPVNAPPVAAESCPMSLASPRACPFGGACHTCPARVQAKLAVSQPTDVYEQEADRMAEAITRTAAPSILQRKCTRCGDENEEELQRKEATGQELDSELRPETLGMVRDVLQSTGQPLDEATRRFMEPHFGHDFSQVRIHADARAAQSAQVVNSRAFTLGKEIVFGAGQYAPSTNVGCRLIAHEVTHVGQQHDNAAGPNPGMLQRAHPAVIAGAAVGAFALGFGGAAAIDYLSMTRARAERYARELDTLYPGWLSALPNCPCEAPVSNTANWVRDSNPDLQTYHPGATSSFRSTSAATGGSRHGQQCTYDAANRLITSGPGAGTPDVYSPSWGILNIPYHLVYDVKTWKELGWSTYNRYWRPNNGNGCSSNTGGPRTP